MTKLGAGPILCLGANINPIVYKKLPVEFALRLEKADTGEW